MATYKIPQNVEAEDKLLGPFSFKQFIYLMIASFAIFMAWLVGRISPWLIVFPAPVIIVFAILGLYHREDQPVETYLLAAINFITKPRRRKWDPEGLVENVKITAPKKKAVTPPKQFEQGQLERLAHIVDTRGWYIKRPELQEPIAEIGIADDDRLINPGGQVSPTEAPVHDIDDMLGVANPDAQEYEQLAETSHANALAEAKAKMKSATRNRQTGKAASAGVEVPTKVHYDPYGNITQHKLNPSTGKYSYENAQPAKPQPARRADRLPLTEHAKAAERQRQQLAKNQPTDIGQGGEVSLRKTP